MENIFHSAQLCLQFSRNRDGSPRERPHVMYPDNGRITAPKPEDDQGRLAFLDIRRHEGESALLFIDQSRLCLIDKDTQITVLLDDTGVLVIQGEGDTAKRHLIPAVPG